MHITCIATGRNNIRAPYASLEFSEVYSNCAQKKEQLYVGESDKGSRCQTRYPKTILG